MNPYDVLGLSAGEQATDDDVRAAWRRIASATHPDREDGGDPERFAQAAAAYNELRTEYRRNAAREDARPAAARKPARFPAWPVILLRIVIAVIVGLAGALAAPNDATGLAIVVGAATWLGAGLGLFHGAGRRFR